MEVYQITFPKLAKGVLQEKIGDRPFQLVVTSLLGKVELIWKDVSFFYK